ncbi:MAG: hypothetical protein P1V97_07860, partial [Planctomycetota bacterium]|nr:hypothetical protein [Planctomycetota bacterium]
IESLCSHSHYKVREAAFAAVIRFKIPLTRSALDTILQNKVVPSEAVADSSMVVALKSQLKPVYLNQILIPLFQGQLKDYSATVALILLDREDLPFGDEVKALCLTMDGEQYGKAELKRRVDILQTLLKGVSRDELGSVAGLLDKTLPSKIMEALFSQLRKNANDSERAALLKFLGSRSPGNTELLKQRAAVIVLEQGQREIYSLVRELSDVRLLLGGIKSHKLSLRGTQNLLNLTTNSVLNLEPKSRRSEIRLACKMLSSLMHEKDRIQSSDKKKMREKLLAMMTSLEDNAWKELILVLGEGFTTVCSRADRDAFLASEESRMRFLGIQLCELLPSPKDQKDDGLEILAKLSLTDKSDQARLQAGLALIRRRDSRGVQALLNLLDSAIPNVQAHARSNLRTLYPRQEIERVFPDRKIPKEKPLKLRAWDRDAINVPHSTLMP